MEEQEKRLIKPNNFDISEIVSELQGSCKTLDEVLENLYEIDVEALTQEDHSQLDSEIFLCESCGWWYEISEQQDESMCGDCYEKEINDLNGETDEEDE